MVVGPRILRRIIGRIRFQSWKIDVYSCRHSTNRYRPKFTNRLKLRESNPLGLNQFQINPNPSQLDQLQSNGNQSKSNPMDSNPFGSNPMDANQFGSIPMSSNSVGLDQVSFNRDGFNAGSSNPKSIQYHGLQSNAVRWIEWQPGLTRTNPIECRPVD